MTFSEPFSEILKTIPESYGVPPWIAVPYNAPPTYARPPSGPSPVDMFLKEYSTVSLPDVVILKTVPHPSLLAQLPVPPRDVVPYNVPFTATKPAFGHCPSLPPVNE